VLGTQLSLVRMNPIEQLVTTFQDLVSLVPAALQPAIVFLAGAVPFIEGEGGALIGVVGGIHPVVAAVAAAAGNFTCVLLIVLITTRARVAVVTRREPGDAQTMSKGRARFAKWVVRFGVPGASILGPLAIPTQITSAILAAGGTPKGWILLWQGVAIALWTAVTTVAAWLALLAVVPAA
jgi:hypothetical protein